MKRKTIPAIEAFGPAFTEAERNQVMQFYVSCTHGISIANVKRLLNVFSRLLNMVDVNELGDYIITDYENAENDAVRLLLVRFYDERVATCVVKEGFERTRARHGLVKQYNNIY